MDKVMELRQLLASTKEEVRGLLAENKVTDAESKMKEVRSLEKKIELQIELDKEEERQVQAKMETEKRTVKGENKVEERAAFDKFLETREITDGVKLDSGFAVVPEETKTEIIELADEVFRLKDLVTVKKVKNASGKQPVRTTAKAKLHSVDELAKSPEIAVTPFTEVSYDVVTKRGYIPVSEELKEDGVNVVSDLKQYIGETVVNTENDDIMTVLKSLTAKTIGTADEIKDIVNTNFPVGRSKNIKFLMSQTVYNAIDKLKDGNGRYLLQDSISAASGKMLFGKDVIVLNDDELPTKNTMFVGDFKEIVYFDRSQVQVQWTNYLHYGECLGVAIRNDVKKIEDDNKKVNIKKITFSPKEPEAPGVEG